MKPIASLFIAITITLVIAGNYFFFFGSNEIKRENVTVSRVIDGDTVELQDGRHVRLVNINTPEKKEFGHDEAMDFLKSLENSKIDLEVRGTEKYGRTLGAVYAPYYVNLEIINRGLASTLLVDEREVDEFTKAQKEAVDSERGIWKRSQYYGCLTAEINKKQEYVAFLRRCNSTLKGWTVKDETTHAYKLPEINEERFTLYSEKGEGDRTNLYWGRGSVWNDDRDTLIVRDENGLLVLFQHYGLWIAVTKGFWFKL